MRRRGFLVILCVLLCGCGGQDSGTLENGEVLRCLTDERVATAEADSTRFAGARNISVAYSLAFFQFAGESATDAGWIIFSEDANGVKAVEEAIRRQTASLPGEPLTDAEFDSLLDREANVLVMWQQPPEERTRSAVLGCLA